MEIEINWLRNGLSRGNAVCKTDEIRARKFKGNVKSTAIFKSRSLVGSNAPLGHSRCIFGVVMNTTLLLVVFLLTITAGYGQHAKSPVTSSAVLQQETTLKSALGPCIKAGGFKMPGYILWCPSVIKVGNTFHMFASRWPQKYGLAGWTKYSEIVRATSKILYGPYTFQEVVIQKRPGFWDNDRAHNPKIIRYGNKYVLFYISSANETGYAVADKITGPWKRSDHVVLPFSNPAPLVRKNGSIYVFGRKAVGGKRIAQAYQAPALAGPYTLLAGGHNLLQGDAELEDPTIWWQHNRYNVLVSDFGGKATGISKSGAQYYSTDGIHYTLVSKEPVYTKTVEYDDGSQYVFRRRERPFVYTDTKGVPLALFTACLTADEASWIEVQPIKE